MGNSTKDPKSFRYAVYRGCTCAYRQGGSLHYVSNFVARITEEIIVDDGLELKRYYQIVGRVESGRNLPSVIVSATEFPEVVKWIGEKWGAPAVVGSGARAQSELREAIQHMSKPKYRHIYAHSGWREIRNKQVFLYQGGAVGTTNISVQLEAPLDRLLLPELVENPRDVFRCSLRLLDCGPPTMMVPLLGAIYLAPLASILQPDFALHLSGPTGSLKSELATIAQQHFGRRFDRKNLPANWSSTENAIEETLFTLKDVIAVIDDFAPQGSRQAQARLQAVAERVIRSIGNRSARGRLRSDLTRQTDRPPRCLVISTGEQLPEGSSIQARLIVVEINRAALHLDRITELQDLADRLPHAMRAYLEWLAPQIANMEEELVQIKDKLRHWFHGIGGHLRQAEALAQLALGVACYLQCVEEHGVLDSKEANRIWETTCRALADIGRRETEHLRDSDPAEKYLRTLATLLTQEAVYLAPKEHEENQVKHNKFAEMVGWEDDEHIYFLPDASKKAVVGFLSKAGDHWSTPTRALGELLQRKGFLVAGPDGRPQRQIRIEGKRPRVFQVPLRHLYTSDETDPVREQRSFVSAVPRRPKLGDGRKGVILVS